jgi:predicted alpha/beta-fold hydrolase
MTKLLLNRGWSVLRINQRGADSKGHDLYHAALTSDLESALSSPDLAHYTHLSIIGFSMGGHIALRHALAPTDRRVRAVCAISAPVDLADCATSIDRGRVNLYRRHVLDGLKAAYAQCASADGSTRRALPTPLAEVAKVDTIREWDRLVVVPRFGFGRVDDYYATASVGPRLPSLEIPALYLGAVEDPMIPEPRCRLFLDAAGEGLVTRWVRRGGHVAFPRHVDFGLGPQPGLEAQTEAWLSQRCPA